MATPFIENEELRRFLDGLAKANAPTDEDRSAARSQALQVAGLSLLGTPKGQVWGRAGQAGMNALAAKQNYLADIPKQRGAALHGAMQAMTLQQQLQALQEQQASKAKMDTLMQSSAVPGMPAMGPPTASGEMQPEVAPSFDKKRFGAGLWSIDPVKALAFEQAQAKESPFAKIDPSKFTQESLQRYTQTGNAADLKSVDAEPVGKINPSDFTSESLARFRQTKDYADLKPIDKRAITNVSVKNVGESEYDKTLGKSSAEQYVAYQTAGRTADATIGRLNAIDKLLSGVDTSGLTPIGMQVSAAAKGVGIDLDPKLPAKQAAVALTNELALQSRQGGQMPGAMSDKDREFLQAMNPNLGQTPEGRALLIDTRKKVAQREKEVARMAREYAAKNNGRIDAGFDTVLAAYADAHPLFQRDESPAAATPSKVYKYDKNGRLIP